MNILISGGQGSGKTLTMKIIAARLRGQGHKVFCVSEENSESDYIFYGGLGKGIKEIVGMYKENPTEHLIVDVQCPEYLEMSTKNFDVHIILQNSDVGKMIWGFYNSKDKEKTEKLSAIRRKSFNELGDAWNKLTGK